MKTVIYARVSKNDKSQDPENQLKPLRKWGESLGYEIVEEFVDYVSGGNSNRPAFKKMMEESKRQNFKMILCWSLDRFSREGISNTLSYLEALKRSGVALKSQQESWLDTSDEGMGQLLIAIISWVAKQERLRISERTKAGLKIAKENGKLLGRKTGSKDKGKRNNSGYLLRWAREKALA